MLPSLHGKNPSGFSVRVGSSSITVQLDQPKHKHVRDDNWRQVSDTRRPASDLLRVSIHWHAEKVEGLRLVWEDRADATIEQSLQEIVISLIVAGEMQIRIAEIQQHRRRVEQKARLIEDERKRDEETRRKEHEKRKRFEQACIDHLLESAVALRMANDLRAYVQAVEKCNASSTDPLFATEMNEWRIWALAQADRIDPLLSRAFLKIVEEPVETEQIKPLEKHHGLPPLLTAETIKPQWHPNHWYAQLYRK